MKLDSSQLMRLVSDHPWPGCQIELFGLQVTLMSSTIAAMLLTAGILAVGVIYAARRWSTRPGGAANVLEVIIIFVRDMIARPALGPKAYEFLPFLLTLFLFVLGLNLMGLVPLEGLSKLVGLPIGGAATAVPVICAALAAITLLSIVSLGLRRQAIDFAHRNRVPLWVGVIGSPVLWFKSLCPQIPGPAGVILALPLSLLELIGAIAKCGSLMIRLFANMIAGHAILALLLLFFLQAFTAAIRGSGYQVGFVAPAVVMASVALSLLELLVAGIQAYIFTFLTAMFLGLYAEPSH